MPSDGSFLKVRQLFFLTQTSRAHISPKDDNIAPANIAESNHDAHVHVHRRFQFSSSLKRMSTISVVTVNSTPRVLIAVKGAPETLKAMYRSVPDEYEATYKWYAQRGSRVLALGYKYMDKMVKKDVSRLIWVPSGFILTSVI